MVTSMDDYIKTLNKSFSGLDYTLTNHQVSVLSLLSQVEPIAKNWHNFSFGYTVENEIVLERIVPNVERAIIIGQGDNDVYFVSFAGRPVQSKFLHLQNEGVKMEHIIQLFTEGLN